MLTSADYGNDATATIGSISYADATITWTGALPEQVAVQISYSIKVHGDAIAALGNRVVSTAVGSTCDAASSNPLCVTSTTVAPVSISLAGLTPGFTLTGPPNPTATADGAVLMRC